MAGNLRRWVGGALLGGLLGTVLSVTASGQPFTAQIQRAIANLTLGTTVFTQLVVNKNAIVTTSTDGQLIANTTAATAGVPVQMSPRLKWQGNAWDTAASETVAFFAETLPATAATPTGTWKLGYSLNGAAATYPLTLSSTGALTVPGDIVANVGNILAANVLGFTTANTYLKTTAAKNLLIVDSSTTTGMEINVGTPTLGTCTAGALTSGSHNFAGEITGNTSGSCILNFGAPNFTNTPICFAMSRTSLTHPRISAASNSSITITGGVSGEAIGYSCTGRIGT